MVVSESGLEEVDDPDENQPVEIGENFVHKPTGTNCFAVAEPTPRNHYIKTRHNGLRAAAITAELVNLPTASLRKSCFRLRGSRKFVCAIFVQLLFPITAVGCPVATHLKFQRAAFSVAGRFCAVKCDVSLPSPPDLTYMFWEGFPHFWVKTSPLLGFQILQLSELLVLI